MARKLRSAVELVSDIGSKAFDLQHHSERDIAEAVAILRTVNGPIFDWLTAILGQRPQDEPTPTETSSKPHGGDCDCYACDRSGYWRSVRRGSQ